MKNVNELLKERNFIDAQIAAIESGITSENEVIFISEVLNLLDGVGENFVSGDYYAPDRMYSNIKGVKNIRLIDREIYVKVTAPSGYLLPDSLRIRGNAYVVRFESIND